MEIKPYSRERMPVFGHEAVSLVDKVMQNYRPFDSMNVQAHRAFQQDLVSGIEQSILGKDKASGPIPLPEATGIFDKMMYLAALYDAKEETKDGAISRAAEFLGYSREHFSREIRKQGIDTEPFRLQGQKSRADFAYFHERLLEGIVSGQMSKYKASLPVSESEDLQKQASAISRDLASRLSEMDIYRLYVNRMSFIYKIAKDVLEERYESVKGSPKAYRELQNGFEARYLRVLVSEAANGNELARAAGVSERTLERAFKKAA